MAQVYAMPASEFIGWQAYFEIYPFTFEREDARHAELISSLTFILSTVAQGRYLKKPIPSSDLIPDYLDMRPEPVRKSREQQKAEFAAFVTKHQEMTKAAKGK